MEWTLQNIGYFPSCMSGCGESRCLRWSGSLPKLPLLSSSRKNHPWKTMAPGNGLPRSDEPRGVLGRRTRVVQEDGKLRCPAGASRWLSEVRQENACTEARPSPWPTRRIVSRVFYGNGAWQKAAKGDRVRRVSAVRRLLPPPAPVSVERKPVLLGSMRWVDVAGRALRRTGMSHWRRQYVEILALADLSPTRSPPARPPRAVRSHHRWSWQDRLACNAWSGPPRQRITGAGVPTFLASNEDRRN